jgi:chromosome segregation ATPase
VDDETTQVVEETGQDAGEQQEQAQPDYDSLQKELKALRRENAKWRTQLRAIEEREQEKAKAEMTEAERLKAELKEAQEARTRAERERQAVFVKSQVISAAAKAGFADPEDAYRMLDTLEVDDEGRVDGLGDALAGLLKAKPYLAKQNAANFSPTNPAAGAGKPSDEQILQEIYGSRRSTLFTGGGVFSANQSE